MSRSGALDRIDALLGTVTDPAFSAVMRGEPMSISQTPVLAFWLNGRSVDFLTLADESRRVDLTIRAYFRMQVSQDVRESLELNVWDAIVNIDSALRGDSNLSGNVSDISIGGASTGYSSIGGLAYRTIDIPLQLEILGEVAIAP